MHWNPVLSHVSRETGLEIELKVAALPKSGEELANPAGADFVLAPVPYMDGGWDSHYRIVARRAGTLKLQVLSRSDSRFTDLSELRGEKVLQLPDLRLKLLARAEFARRGIGVVVDEVSTPDSALVKLLGGGASAAIVTSDTLEGASGGIRRQFDVLFESAEFPEAALFAHVRVPQAVARSVANSLVKMEDDPVGAGILKESAKLLGQARPVAFRSASKADFQPATEFLRKTHAHFAKAIGN